jgi:hypothetical protein
MLLLRDRAGRAPLRAVGRRRSVLLVVLCSSLEEEAGRARRAGRRTAASGCSARPRTRRLGGPETHWEEDRRRWLLCSAWEEGRPGLGGGQRREKDGPGIRWRSFSSAVAGRRSAGGWAGRRGAGGGASSSSLARVYGWGNEEKNRMRVGVWGAAGCLYSVLRDGFDRAHLRSSI